MPANPDRKSTFYAALNRETIEQYGRVFPALSREEKINLVEEWHVFVTRQLVALPKPCVPRKRKREPDASA